MVNYKIYFYATAIFIGTYLLLVFLIISPFVCNFRNTSLFNDKIELTKQEVKQMSVMAGDALANTNKEKVISSIQNSISGSDDQKIYLSVFDWSGNYICHPNITNVGEKNNLKSNLLSNIKNSITGEELFLYLKKKQNNTNQKSEVIALQAIPNSDLIIAAHLNLEKVFFDINKFKVQINSTFFTLGLGLLICLLVIVRLLSSRLNKIIDSRTAKLEDGVLNLSKLNTSIENYQKSISEIKNTPETPVAVKNEEDDTKKERLLTYIRNELVPVTLEDISYIYVENAISYVVRNDGKRYTANDSLDQIYSFLDPKIFFRANRQTIVSIYAIDKIIKYGNSALKIEMKPTSEIDIIIGKNKVSVFKKWLNL